MWRLHSSRCLQGPELAQPLTARSTYSKIRNKIEKACLEGFSFFWSCTLLQEKSIVHPVLQGAAALKEATLHVKGDLGDASGIQNGLQQHFPFCSSPINGAQQVSSEGAKQVDMGMKRQGTICPTTKTDPSFSSLGLQASQMHRIDCRLLLASLGACDVTEI